MKYRNTNLYKWVCPDCGYEKVNSISLPENYVYNPDCKNCGPEIPFENAHLMTEAEVKEYHKSFEGLTHNL